MNLKKTLHQVILFSIIVILFSATSNTIFAKEIENYKDVVEYDLFDENNATEEEIAAHINTGYKNYYINLDKTYNTTIKIKTTGEEGTVNVNISAMDESNHGGYEELAIGNQEITTKLQAGTYQLQISACESQRVSYSLEISYQESSTNDNSATAKFLKDNYTVDVSDSIRYEDGAYGFWEELRIKGYSDYRPEDISWSINKKSIAVVNNVGDLTVKKPGKVKLTAKLPNGKITSCTITVPKPTYSISETKYTLYTGYILNLEVTASTEYDDMKVTWSTSNKKVATVTRSGKVTTKSAGTCIISAKVDGKVVKCKLTVKKRAKIVDIAKYLNNANALKKHKNKSFSYKSNGNKVTYAKIKGEYATFKGLGEGDMLVYSAGKLKGFHQIDESQNYMSVTTTYYNSSTKETVAVSSILGFVTEIEYWR